MSKRRLMVQSWDLATQITGAHKARCMALTEMTGLPWVCRHLSDQQGQRALYYVVPRGPDKHVGGQFINIINHKLYNDAPVFEMVGDHQAVMGVRVDRLLGAEQKEIAPQAAAELKRALAWLTAEAEGAAALAQAQ